MLLLLALSLFGASRLSSLRLGRGRLRPRVSLGLPGLELLEQRFLVGIRGQLCRARILLQKFVKLHARDGLDAVIAVQGKPSKAVSAFKDERFHLVQVDYAKPLQGDYLPASLSAKDYPNLISDQEQVDTIAVPAVLAAYNWAPNTERYRKLALFVDAFFTKFPTFQNPPFHPKWKEVSLSAPLPDWQRFPAAKQWLDSHGIEPVARVRFDEFQKQNAAASPKPASDADKEALFRQFQAWDAEQTARALASTPPKQR